MNTDSDGTKLALWCPILAALLWALSAALSVLIIPYTLEAVTRVFVAFWGDTEAYGRDYWNVVMIRQFLTAVLAGFAVVVIIGGAEYHTRAFNTERSWRLLASTLALEVALLLVAVIV
jgi:hypothetical protein